MLPRHRARLTALAALAVTAVASAGDIDPRAAIGVTAERLWLYGHLLLFVFWLGADLGVFLCSREIVKPGLSADQRLRTARLMRSIDLAPRVSASLMLTAGGVLTEYVGIAHPWWQMAGIIVLGPAWLTLVLVGYLRDGTALGDAVANMDQGFRGLLVVVIPVSVARSWWTGRLDPAPYVAAKLLIFALLMLVGLMLRQRLRPFTDGLRSMALAGGSPAIEDEMRLSHSRTRPLVVAIWVGLAVAALLGIAKPGGRVEAAPENVSSVVRVALPLR